MGKLRNKLAAKGPVVLYHGSLAAAAATAVGHFPWFYTFNSLQAYIPVPKTDETLKKFSRNALIGFLSSVGKNSCFGVGSLIFLGFIPTTLQGKMTSHFISGIKSSFHVIKIKTTLKAKNNSKYSQSGF